VTEILVLVRREEPTVGFLQVAQLSFSGVDNNSSSSVAALQHIRESVMTGDVLTELTGHFIRCGNNMDVTSDALYAIFLNALMYAPQMPAPSPSYRRYGSHSCEAVFKYDLARPGDRTLVDTTAS
jgi:hypothetical protein